MNRAEILQKSVEEQKACKLLSVSSHLVLSQRKLILYVKKTHCMVTSLYCVELYYVFIVDARNTNSRVRTSSHHSVILVHCFVSTKMAGDVYDIRVHYVYVHCTSLKICRRERLSFQSLNICVTGRLTWASHIKHLLFLYGFGFVWVSHQVADIDVFISTFKQRLIDCHKQNLHHLLRFITVLDDNETAYVALYVCQR